MNLTTLLLSSQFTQPLLKHVFKVTHKIIKFWMELELFALE